MPKFSGKTDHKINMMTQSIGIPQFMMLLICMKNKLQVSSSLMKGSAFITQQHMSPRVTLFTCL